MAAATARVFASLLRAATSLSCLGHPVIKFFNAERLTAAFRWQIRGDQFGELSSQVVGLAARDALTQHR